mgnify:CR=1 FL=1
MPASKRVGVSDIAKHAGVSIGTVSNYLNYPERVSDTLKEKIGASIKELGYTPRRNTLLPQRENAGPRLIGYIMTDIEHSLFTFIHEGAQEVCEENDLQLIALNASSDAQRQNELVKTLIDMNVAGILLSTISDSPEDVAAARAANIPIILLDHTNPRHADQVCCVLENNMAAGQIAADELIRIGCSRIAFAAHSFDYESVQDRQMGVEKTIARTHGSTQLELINSKGLMFEDGYQLGLDIIDTMKRSGLDAIPDGIITVSDALAAGVLSAFHDHNGPRVPEDVCVIGMEGATVGDQMPHVADRSERARYRHGAQGHGADARLHRQSRRTRAQHHAYRADSNPTRIHTRIIACGTLLAQPNSTQYNGKVGLLTWRNPPLLLFCSV